MEEAEELYQAYKRLPRWKIVVDSFEPELMSADSEGPYRKELWYPGNSSSDIAAVQAAKNTLLEFSVRNRIADEHLILFDGWIHPRDGVLNAIRYKTLDLWQRDKAAREAADEWSSDDDSSEGEEGTLSERGDAAPAVRARDGEGDTAPAPEPASYEDEHTRSGDEAAAAASDEDTDVNDEAAIVVASEGNDAASALMALQNSTPARFPELAREWDPRTTAKDLKMLVKDMSKPVRPGRPSTTMKKGKYKWQQMTPAHVQSYDGILPQDRPLFAYMRPDRRVLTASKPMQGAVEMGAPPPVTNSTATMFYFDDDGISADGFESRPMTDAAYWNFQQHNQGCPFLNAYSHGAGLTMVSPNPGGTTYEQAVEWNLKVTAKKQEPYIILPKGTHRPDECRIQKMTKAPTVVIPCLSLDPASPPSKWAVWVVFCQDSATKTNKYKCGICIGTIASEQLHFADSIAAAWVHVHTDYTSIARLPKSFLAVKTRIDHFKLVRGDSKKYKFDDFCRSYPPIDSAAESVDEWIALFKSTKTMDKPPHDDFWLDGALSNDCSIDLRMWYPDGKMIHDFTGYTSDTVSRLENNLLFRAMRATHIALAQKEQMADTDRKSEQMVAPVLGVGQPTAAAHLLFKWPGIQLTGQDMDAAALRYSHTVEKPTQKMEAALRLKEQIQCIPSRGYTAVQLADTIQPRAHWAYFFAEVSYSMAHFQMDFNGADASPKDIAQKYKKKSCESNPRVAEQPAGQVQPAITASKRKRSKKGHACDQCNVFCKTDGELLEHIETHKCSRPATVELGGKFYCTECVGCVYWPPPGKYFQFCDAESEFMTGRIRFIENLLDLAHEGTIYAKVTGNCTRPQNLNMCFVRHKPDPQWGAGCWNARYTNCHGKAPVHMRIDDPKITGRSTAKATVTFTASHKELVKAARGSLSGMTDDKQTQLTHCTLSFLRSLGASIEPLNLSTHTAVVEVAAVKRKLEIAEANVDEARKVAKRADDYIDQLVASNSQLVASIAARRAAGNQIEACIAVVSDIQSQVNK